MKTDLDSLRPSGFQTNEPKVIGSIIEEMLQSNSPLARGYRRHQASHKGNVAEKGGIA